jgi:hypothetical protein
MFETCYTRLAKDHLMSTDSILNSNLNINALADDSGKRYFKLKVSFSEEDILTIYRNSVDELLEDLPQVLVSAIRARIIQDQITC